MLFSDIIVVVYRIGGKDYLKTDSYMRTKMKRFELKEIVLKFIL